MMSTEKKVILIGGVITALFLFGAVFFLSKSDNPDIPDGQIVARNGLHWHPRLSIYIKGEKKELEDGIGLGALHQPMHTHTEDYKNGVVHMEMQGAVTKDETKLGNFFRIWGKPFSATRLFDAESTKSGSIKMTVNGKENTEFENYQMRENDTIEIRFE